MERIKNGICTRCGNAPAAADNRRCAQCRDKSNAENRARYGANPQHYRNKAKRFPGRYRKYGLTRQDFDRMRDAQGGVCAICKQPPTRRGLYVDHCHSSGVVRGLLCQKCNSGLGMFGDNQSRLASAIDYLSRSAKKESAA